MDNNLNITPITADVAQEAWINSLPDPLSPPPPLTRQTGYIGKINRPDSISPPPILRMSGCVEEEEEVDLESYLKGTVLKQNSKTSKSTPKKKPVLKTFLPVTDSERKLKTIMRIFSSDINSNVKYYERLRREQGFLTTKNGEDIILMHNYLREKTIQKIDELLGKTELTEDATEYVEACFETELNRIRRLHPKPHSLTC